MRCRMFHIISCQLTGTLNKPSRFNKTSIGFSKYWNILYIHAPRWITEVSALGYRRVDAWGVAAIRDRGIKGVRFFQTLENILPILLSRQKQNY